MNDTDVVNLRMVQAHESLKEAEAALSEAKLFVEAVEAYLSN